jgi:uncharacterized protein (DUF2141 family)
MQGSIMKVFFTGHPVVVGRSLLKQLLMAVHEVWASNLLALSVILAATAATAHSEPVDAQVEVSGVRSANGSILVALHDDRWAFPSRWDRAVAFATIAAAEGSVTIPLRLPRPGRFALIVVHDEDGDGRMLKSALGLPREGYATGRNAQTLAFPYFEPAQRDWVDGTRASVRLLYP